MVDVFPVVPQSRWAIIEIDGQRISLKLPVNARVSAPTRERDCWERNKRLFCPQALAAYLERGPDAHSGFGDFDDCDGFDGGACSGPDL
jgi:hypothetical protein